MVDLLAALVALVLLISISLGVAESERDTVAGDLVLLQTAINFLGMIAASIWSVSRLIVTQR